MRAMNAHDLVRAIGEIDLPEPLLTEPALSPEGTHAVLPTFAALQSARDRASSAIDEWVCRAPGGAHDSELERARRRLVVEATAARARGIALQQARRIAGEAGGRWVARRLYGGPWPQQGLEPGTEQLLTDLIESTHAAGNHEVQSAGPSFELLSTLTPGRCLSLRAR
jgi:hypothetical protein